MFHPEVSELKRRYNILREQYQKLQGAVKTLQATIDELTVSRETAEKERDKYKSAFEDIFTSNIGDEWEKLPDDKKKKMTIEDKLSFFENELNTTKLYIRRQMAEQMEKTIEDNLRMKNEIVSLKAKLEDKETQLKNADSIIANSTRPMPKPTVNTNNQIKIYKLTTI